MIASPFTTRGGAIRPEWLSEGVPHLNFAFYLVLLDAATRALFEALEIGAAHLEATGHIAFVGETHVVYEREMNFGDDSLIATTLLNADEKRLHFAHELFRPGEERRMCLQELLYVNMDTRAGRTAPFTPEAAARIAAALAAHSTLPRPVKTGRSVGIRSAKLS